MKDGRLVSGVEESVFGGGDCKFRSKCCSDQEDGTRLRQDQIKHRQLPYHPTNLSRLFHHSSSADFVSVGLFHFQVRHGHVQAILA